MVAKTKVRSSASTIRFEAFDVHPVGDCELVIVDNAVDDSNTDTTAGPFFDVVAYWTRTLPEAQE